MQLFRLSRLSGQLLSHITLCISATFSKGLVCSTQHSTSTQKRLAINYSSSLIIKLSSLPGSLVVLTWFSLVGHPAAFSFSGLALCLLHSETLPCPRPRGLMPSTRIVSPCFARPRFQLGLSSRAPPDLTKRARSTLSDRSWLAFITMYSTLRDPLSAHSFRTPRSPTDVRTEQLCMRCAFFSINDLTTNNRPLFFLYLNVLCVGMAEEAHAASSTVICVVVLWGPPTP